jgi:hypothetical protein
MMPKNQNNLLILAIKLNVSSKPPRIAYNGRNRGIIQISYPAAMNRQKSMNRNCAAIRKIPLFFPPPNGPAWKRLGFHAGITKLAP